MTSITRRQFSTGLTVGLAGAVAAPSIVRAQGAFPAAGQTIKVIVGFPPGGSQDINGRIVADRLAALWNASVVVENVSGAGANIAMDRVAKGPQDGSQILVVPPGIATNPFLYSKLSFDPEKDIHPIGLVSTQPNLLVATKSLPVSNVAELIAYAKANPGKISFATTGIGTTTHLSGELFKRMTGVDIKPVHYRGSALALNDLLGGTVEIIFDNISSIVEQVRGGNLKAIGISTAKRAPLAPDYVPIADTVAGYETLSWAGLGVRSGTPKEICDAIEAANRKICKDPMLVSRLNGVVTDVIGSGQTEFAQFISDERSKWGKLITELKIKIGD